MYIFAIIINLILIAADQYTKYLAVQKLKPIGSIPLIESVFQLTYVENRGAAFGMFQGGRWFFLLLSLVVLSGIYYYYVKLPKGGIYRWVRVSLAVISAGALGNLIDRLLNGYVVDFLHFSLINFPVFNLADTFVVTGTIVLAVLIVFFIKDENAFALAGKKNPNMES